MNPLYHPAAHQIPENDIEKRGELKDSSVNIVLSSNSPEDSQTSDVAPTPVILTGRLAKWNAKVEGLAGLGTSTCNAFSLHWVKSCVLNSFQGVSPSKYASRLHILPLVFLRLAKQH